MQPREVIRAVPLVQWLSSYQRRWLPTDLSAGLTVLALLIPEAMAYAQLAGMPAETGLYAGLGGIVGYAVFGTSRELSVGPSSAVAILSASSVAAVAAGLGGADRAGAVALSVAMALLVGVLFLGAGLLRLGQLSVFMSRPVLVGFTFGLGLTIAATQLPALFGVAPTSGNFFHRMVDLVGELPDANPKSVVIGSVSLVFLLVARWRLGHRLPAALIVVALGVVASRVFDLAGHGVTVVGQISASVPVPGLPSVGWSALVALTPGALGIVVIAFAEGFGSAEAYARAHESEIDSDSELIGAGAANIASGLLGGFAVGGSLSRTAAADEAGARSQMANLICGVGVLATIVAFGDLFEPLPTAVLAAVVIAAVAGTFDVTEMRRLWHVHRPDFWAALGALLGVCVIDILPGLGIAIGISFALLVYRSSQPRMPLLGRVPGHRWYVTLEHERDAVAPRGVAVMRLDAPLFFANAENFDERVHEVLDAPGAPSALVLDFEGVNFIDTDGADRLGGLLEDLHHRGVDVAVSRLNLDGRATLRRAKVYDLLGPHRFFFSVDEAVRALQAEQPDVP